MEELKSLIQDEKLLNRLTELSKSKKFVTKEMLQVNSIKLREVADALRTKGLGSLVYKLQGPDGSLLESSWNSISSIPSRLWSRDMSHRIHKEDCTIVEGLLLS